MSSRPGDSFEAQPQAKARCNRQRDDQAETTEDDGGHRKVLLGPRDATARAAREPCGRCRSRRSRSP